MPRIIVRGITVDYRVLKTRRNRNVRLTVSARHGVRISAPYGYPERELHAMVRERGEWILDRIERFAQEERQQPRWQYRNGASILLRGVWTPLRVSGWERRSGRIRLEADALVMQVPHEMVDDETVLRDLFERWLRRWACQDIPLRVAALAREMQLKYSRIGIRDQRSKWGSCSMQGSISLNMRLMLVPPSVSDYVITHELAHLRQLNHSARFWRIVEQHCPDFRDRQQWLREHAWLLDMDDT